jgi:hypothetical protein
MVRRKSRGLRLSLALALAFSMLLAVPLPAAAHPEVCDGKELGSDASSQASQLASKVLSSINVFASFLPPPQQMLDESTEQCFTDEEIAAMDDSGADLEPGETDSSRNIRLIGNLRKTGPFDATTAYGSDLAFWGKYAIQGNYEGFQITDISSRRHPRIVAQVDCPGSQNDVSVWENLIFTSTDSRRTNDGCDSESIPSTEDPGDDYWEGMKIFDWSDRDNPVLIKSIETDCGSHTHTLLTGLESTLIPGSEAVLIYVSSYDTAPTKARCGGQEDPDEARHDKISIIEVPLDDPTGAEVVAEPVLFPDGGFPGSETTSETRGCHDITAYQAIDLAAGACMGQGSIIDISDPWAPEVISSVTDPNFAFWHSATFSNDGKTVVFTDELGGGGGPTCNPTVGSRRGANGIYDVSDPANPEFASYYKIPRTQRNSENCVAHNGNVLPVRGRDIMVQAWYQGGLSVFDFSDPYEPRELGWWERGPFKDEPISGESISGGWSSYWYRGSIFTNEIQEGLDVHIFREPVRKRAKTLPYLNVQTQEPLRRH